MTVIEMTSELLRQIRDGVQEITDSLHETNARLSRGLAACNARIDETRLAIAEVETRMDARFDAVDARFDTVDARFEAVDARFDAIDARFGRIDARLDRSDAQILQLTEYVRTAVEHGERRDAAIDDLQVRVERLEGDDD